MVGLLPLLSFWRAGGVFGCGLRRRVPEQNSDDDRYCRYDDNGDNCMTSFKSYVHKEIYLGEGAP